MSNECQTGPIYPLPYPLPPYTDGVGIPYAEPLPILNHSLLERTVSWAQWDANGRSTFLANHPDLEDKVAQIPRWYQADWACVADADADADVVPACSTSFCIAGFVMQNSGHARLHTLSDPDEIASRYGWESAQHAVDAGCALPRVHSYEVVINIASLVPDLEGLGPITDDEDAWSEGARAVLGLTVTEASRLFRGTNTIEDVSQVACDIVASRGLPPLDFDSWELSLEVEQDDVSGEYEVLTNWVRTNEKVAV